MGFLADTSYGDVLNHAPVAARPADVDWVARYRDRAACARYDPHVTIGIGPRPVAAAPFSFPVEEIALCRLGRFCTCRDRLATWKL